MKSPTIGMNELGRYLVEPDPLRRNNIVKEEMRLKNRPQSFYTPARLAIVKSISEGLTDLKTLEQYAEELHSTAATGWKRNQNDLSADAIEAFLDMQKDHVDIERCIPFGFQSQDAPKTYVENVLIRAMPEVILKHTNRKGKVTIGAIKLYINQQQHLTDSLSNGDEAGKFSAALLARYIEKYFKLRYECNYQYCQVVDVFAGKTFRASSSYKRSWKRIEIGCRQVRDGWYELSS